MPTKPPIRPVSSALHAHAVGRNAVVIIAVVVAGAALHWLGDLLTPLFLAIFLMVMIESFTRLLKRIRFLPDWAALGTALAILVIIFLLSAWIIGGTATSFFNLLKGYEPRLNQVIASIAALAGDQTPPTIDQLVDRLNPIQYLGLAADGFRGFMANAAFVLVYLGFLIASRAGFQRKAVMLYPGRDERHRAVQVFERMRFGVERYLWTQTVAGLMIASISWVVMAVVGLDNAFFWAFLIFFLGFIPIFGPLIGAAIPPIFALGQFDSYTPALILVVCLNATHSSVGTLILPRMQGKSLNLDPVVVLLSLAFWDQVWGLAGMFLATPLTVAAMVVLAQFQGSHWIAVLLSGDGDPLGEAKDHKKQSLVEPQTS